MDKLKISWPTAVSLAHELADRINIQFHAMIVVSRGGLFPASILAQRLKIKVVETVCVESYQYYVQTGFRVLKSIDPEIINQSIVRGGRGHGILVVDDICDTGATFQAIRKDLPLAFYLSLYVKPQGASQVDLAGHSVPQNQWVEFPWEVVPLFPAASLIDNTSQ